MLRLKIRCHSDSMSSVIMWFGKLEKLLLLAQCRQKLKKYKDQDNAAH